MRNCHDERALLCAILEPVDLIEGKYKSLNRMPGTSALVSNRPSVIIAEPSGQTLPFKLT